MTFSYIPKMVKNLDFIVIGAQKAGTTALYHYLKPSLEIYLPPEKEAPFFDRNQFYEKGWEWYINKYFTSVPKNRKWGTVTPSYMSDMRVPERIYKEMPEVKLIALLRNPIDRAVSHYRMAVKRGDEKEEFSQILSKRLQPYYLNNNRILTGETKNYNSNRYFVLGEYGRILEQYLSFFTKNNFLVVFSENLLKYPKATLSKICNFLEINDNFQAPIHRRYHVGGTRKRFPWKGQEIVNNNILNFFIKSLPNSRGELVKRRFLFWYDIWNTIPEEQSLILNKIDRKVLADFYYQDVSKLRRLLFPQLIPWEDFE